MIGVFDRRTRFGGFVLTPGPLSDSSFFMIKKIEQIQHTPLQTFISRMAELCQPADIQLCDGSDAEWDQLTSSLVKTGTLIRLNPDKRPNSFLARSAPSDVARVEERTFICSKREDQAGPTNNWMEDWKMEAILKEKFNGCMKGRTMYIIPFCMGPLASPLAKVGVQVTDSPYAVLNMRIMTHMGADVLKMLEKERAGKVSSRRTKPGFFIPCVHSVGAPLEEGEADVPWPCNDDKYIVHFPATREIWSYGSGYGGNALLGKKCLALRIATNIARDHGWLAEHMLILGLEEPNGNKTYVTGAFPSACGKTNLSMLVPPEQYQKAGWKTSIVGDDIAWLWPHEDGKLHAINPETGYFGVAPGTSWKSNPTAMETLRANCIFTNVALTDDGDVWWEDMTKEPPAHLIDWKGNDWTPDSDTPAAHPNARFTAPADQCPTIDPDWQNPDGVPVDAIVFGGRRKTTMPLIYEAFNWSHGIYIGATMGSEKTAAAAGQTGQVRRDPFAMLPFAGYNMGSYFRHWFQLQKHVKLPPRFFHVNWFRRDADGGFLWPGFGENIRVLEWIIHRCNGKARAHETRIGWVPEFADFNFDELEFDAERFAELMAFDPEEWKQEVISQSELFLRLFHTMPKQLVYERELLSARLS
jgi:phosphoenolpyruvate carboxykinase (GTP)